MRILLATGDGTVVGGVETYLRALLPALVARGHSVGLLHERCADAHGARLDEGMRAADVIAVERTGRAGAVAAATRWSPDCVFAHGLLDAALEGELQRRFPTVLFVHCYYGTCVTGHKYHRRPALRACRRRLSLACLGLNYVAGCGARNPRTLLAMYAQQRRRARLLPSFRRLIVASAWMREELLRNGADPAAVEVIAPIPHIPRDPRFSGGGGAARRIGLVGRLGAAKGGELLVEAIALAAHRLGRRLELVVVGSGPEGPRIEATARRRGVPARFAGWLGGPALVEALRGIDLLAMPSIWPEPFGLSGVEAAGLGIPCVAFDHGGIRDWNEPGVTGEVAEARPPSATSLSEALVRALADPAHLASLSRSAWERSARFGAHRHVLALESILAAAAGVTEPVGDGVDAPPAGNA